jgi:hypothetical protein
VVARIGVELGVVDPDLESTTILLAAATATLAPVGYRPMAPAAPGGTPRVAT